MNSINYINLQIWITKRTQMASTSTWASKQVNEYLCKIELNYRIGKSQKCLPMLQENKGPKVSSLNFGQHLADSK